MANASTTAARRGWEIFRSRVPRVPLDEINQRLIMERLAPPTISPRSYRHYRAMDARGIVDYLSINEFDQWIKANRFTSARDVQQQADAPHVSDKSNAGRHPEHI
jgi:hypothetical protein